MLCPAAKEDFMRAGEQVWRMTHGIIAVRLSARRESKKDERTHNLFLISSYSPSRNHKKAERQEHLEELERCIKKCSAHETLIVGTDANENLGILTEVNPNSALGKFGVPTSQPVPVLGVKMQNRTLRMLVRNRLCAATTFFKSTTGYYTHIGHGKHGTSKAQLDHFYIKRRDLRKCKKAWSAGKAVVESDHRRISIVLADTPFHAKQIARKGNACLAEFMDADSAATKIFTETLVEGLTAK